jgi:hypothetical protein
MRTTRTYVKGTLLKPAVKKRPGRQIYKHYHPEDRLYYKSDGKYYCICDDRQASGFVFKNETGKEVFMPHDFADNLISYEEAIRMCKQHDVYLPKPGHARHGNRTPPPLLIAKTPTKTRPMWNRDAIKRHIEECQRRKQNAGLR